MEVTEENNAAVLAIVKRDNSDIRIEVNLDNRHEFRCIYLIQTHSHNFGIGNFKKLINYDINLFLLMRGKWNL